MRAPLLFAAVFALAACGKSNQADTTQNVGESLSAENIVSNDVTAIDAVTGDAANMAADVDMNFGNIEENDIGAASNETAPKPRSAAPRKAEPARTTTEPAANNTAATTPTNAE
jgi:hypothetical protein